MRKAFAVLLTAALVPSGFMIAAAQKKTSSSKKTSSTAKKSTATAKKSTASTKKSTTPAKKSTVSTKKKTTTAKKSSPSKSSSRRTTASSWRTRQMQPTPDRYKEIQQALIEKGYLEGPATGKWGQDSIGALRRFQEEQNLEASGKIDSLSLIALGLGPKYDTAAVTAAPPPVPRP